MFDKIVLGVDGSESSSSAADLASKMVAEVVVVHVRERAPGRARAFDFETSEEAAGLLDEAVAALKDAGISARGESRRGIQDTPPRRSPRLPTPRTPA
jgi:nucleotide-binding universal stress UspA family protein